MGGYMQINQGRKAQQLYVLYGCNTLLCVYRYSAAIRLSTGADFLK